jgi:hypothetical protein
MFELEAPVHIEIIDSSKGLFRLVADNLVDRMIMHTVLSLTKGRKITLSVERTDGDGDAISIVASSSE